LPLPKERLPAAGNGQSHAAGRKIAGWDGRITDPGAVYVHVKTRGDAPVSSVDFKSQLTANPSNACEN
jgi:hypothetical protein